VIENDGSRKPRFLTSELGKAKEGFFQRFPREALI
jgi:hypothetical protein